MAEASSSSSSTVFQNPVLRGFNPDPTVCVVPATATAPATYFLCTSTFEYFPGCAIYASTDLVNWRAAGHALTRRPAQLDLRTVEPGAGAWACTLRYRPAERRFYLATAAFCRYRPAADDRVFPRGFYVWSDDIRDETKWSDPVFFDNPGFDQDLFWDDDANKVYLSTTVRLARRPAGSQRKDFAIHVSEIDLASGRTLTPPRVVRESPHGIAEGSHLLRRGGYLYLFTAEGGTEAGHQEWVFRSREGVYGPWEAREEGKPLWYNGPDEEVQRTGHADVFEDGDGNWWAVFLGVRPVKAKSDGRYLEPQMGRETFLVKVDWEDDWPVFNDGRNVTLSTQGRAPVEQLVAQIRPGDVKWQAKLDGRDLGLGWYQKNTPLKRCYTMAEKPGNLRVYGNCYSLSSPEAPALLLRKQTSYTETFQAKLEFNPRKTGYEAGMVLWWSQYSYASVGFALHETEGGTYKTIVVRQPSGQAGVMKTSYPLLAKDPPSKLSTDALSFQVETFPEFYRLSFNCGTVEESFEVEAQHLTVPPPIGGAFCGTMFGIYSFGHLEPVLDPADFYDIVVKEA
ncbi:beta-xylosidase [Xylariomycetidae sp. FL0641]|nr:beta-xylosidase [Xylariomycetidae sp. FL0641]